MESTLHKINRLRQGKKPRVLDLFAGCGGISLGFKYGGFEIIGALEIDATAAKTHGLNFFGDSTDPYFEVHQKSHDITETEPEEFILSIGKKKPERAVDIIVGGPPCQAFARVGRAKLREVAEHPEAFLKDPRSNLYLRYLHYVKCLRPIALLMENVPDVLNYGGHNIAEEVCESLEDLGYECKYTLLNSVNYGVPQMRERMFLLAILKEFSVPVSHPKPTHWIELPRGYYGSRQVALKYIQNDLFSDGSHYVDPPALIPDGLHPAITVKEALEDLPVITEHLSGNLKRGVRRFDKLHRYPNRKPTSPYAKLMRNWPGFENQEGVYDHVIRSLPRDYQIFERMCPGDQYPEAHQHSLEILREVAEKNHVESGSPTYEELRKKIVPPYDPGKFPNKWRKMESFMPSRTLMAHLGKDSYSHIHYDSSQARTISVREAARLQSFPDGFVFAGAMNAAFRQIGNAVPPLMARSIADEILKSIKLISNTNETCN